MTNICVFAGANTGNNRNFTIETSKLAKKLASQSFQFVYGGGSNGLMGVFSNEVIEKKGNIVGVIPDFLLEKETPNENLSKLTIVETMHERKKLMYENVDGFVILPGGLGTLDEVMEVLTWKQLGLIKAPMFFLNVDKYWNPLIKLLDHLFQNGFVHNKNINSIIFEKNADILYQKIQIIFKII